MAKTDSLILPDLHIPYEHNLALRFAKEVRKDFGIPWENIYSLGDELDLFAGGKWPKGGDAPHTANQEIEIAREKVRKWGAAFPDLKICESNHVTRWMRKAFDAELPSQVIRSIEEIYEYPEGWKLEPFHVVDAGKAKFRLQHGDGYSGPMGMRQAAIDNGMSTIIGHLHSNAGVTWIKTANQEIFGVNGGCLIDVAAYCFKYGIHSRLKPTIGVTVVLDGGKFPLWVPMHF